MTFAGSWALARNFEAAPLDEILAAVRLSLESCPLSLDDADLKHLAAGATVMDLDRIKAIHEQMQVFRLSGHADAIALADVIEFLELTRLLRNPFEPDPQCPGSVSALVRWAASRLHAYGRPQSLILAKLAADISKWCEANRIGDIAIIDSPLGGSVPTQVIAAVLRRDGVRVTVHELLTPRLARHAHKHSIRAAAKRFCSQLASDSHYILFPDEFVSGTRMLKLYEALKRHLHGRLVPIALQVGHAGNPVRHHDNALKLIGILKECRKSLGIPTFALFPQAAQFQVDRGSPFVAASAFFWSDMDLCAGKRKVNLLFGVLCQVRELSDELGNPDSQSMKVLCDLWRQSTDGTTYSGHEAELARILPPLVRSLDWAAIEAEARSAFPDEYLGQVQLANAMRGAVEKYNWIFEAIHRHAAESDAIDNSGASRAGLLSNALRDLFAYFNGHRRSPMPRDRDFCEYTLAYAEPLHAFHQALVHLVVTDVPG